MVLTIIDLGQKLGCSWQLMGDIFDSPIAVLSKNLSQISIVGLHWASWELNKNE